MPLKSKKYLLCRNKVRDYRKWRKLFDGDAQAHREAGLVLTHVWRDSASKNNVFFLFVVENLKKAKAFISAPDAKQQATESGVTAGDYHFLDSVDLY